MSSPEPDLEFVTQAAGKRTADAIYKYFEERCDSLLRAMQVGDDHLLSHISQQVMQIRDALGAAEKLEIERIEQVRAALEAFKHEREEALQGLRREIDLAREASSEAIEKQEKANEKRFESTNEWRAQSADRERTMQGNLDALTGTFLPREVADKQTETMQAADQAIVLAAQKQTESLRESDRQLAERIALLEQSRSLDTGRRAGVNTSAGVVVGSIVGVGALISMIVVLANVLT